MPAKFAVAVLLLGWTASGVGAVSAQPTLYGSALRERWPEGRVPQGAGFRVDGRGLILTAAHVLAGCRQVWAEAGGVRLPLDLVGLDAEVDLALLRSSGRLEGPPIGALGAPLRRGERGEALRPAGEAQPVTAVGVGSARGLVFAPALQPGLSGSPIVSARGLLVGVASAVDARSTYATPPEAIDRFLRYYGVESGRPRLPRLPLSGDPPSYDAARAQAAVFRLVCD